MAMKNSLLTGVAALFLATGAAHAEDEDYGTKYDCGSVPDYVWVKRKRTASNMWATVITIEHFNLHNRKGKRYPIVRYDVQKDTIALNGKRCREVK
jgi:hypothetical protein